MMDYVGGGALKFASKMNGECLTLDNVDWGKDTFVGRLAVISYVWANWKI